MTQEFRRRWARGGAAWVVAVVAAGGIGCGGSGARGVEVGSPRPYVGPPFEVGADAPTRFGFGEHGGAAPARALASGDAPAQDAFAFELPDGWEQRTSTAMRALDLRVARDPDAECTLTLLGGDAGGLRANVDRWRAQMGLPSIGPEAFDALPRTTLLGRDAVRVDLRGRYAGMGDADIASARLLGLLGVAPEGSAFLKFTGPAGVVAEEEAAFDALAASLRVAAARDGSIAAGDASSEPTSAASNERLRWTAPSGWHRAPDRMMREVTYLTADGAVECYVSILGGDGGGIRANFDRWRGQMGAAPMTADELAALERAPCLGATALLIEIDGDFEGMGGETRDGARMLGAVAPLDGSTVFVKLVGPRDRADAEAANFRAFVESLEAVR